MNKILKNQFFKQENVAVTEKLWNNWFTYDKQIFPTFLGKFGLFLVWTENILF